MQQISDACQAFLMMPMPSNGRTCCHNIFNLSHLKDRLERCTSWPLRVSVTHPVTKVSIQAAPESWSTKLGFCAPDAFASGL